jgi:hypothetical protein
MEDGSNGSKKRFFAGFEAFEKDPGSDPYNPKIILFCVWDLPLRNEGKLMSLISIPEEYQQDCV